MKKIKNSCSGKKGTGCSSQDYVLPYGYVEDEKYGWQYEIELGKSPKASCGGAGCQLTNYTLPNGIVKIVKK